MRPGMICVSNNPRFAPICHNALQPGLTAQLGSGKSLFDRLGGIFPIAAVVNDFSDAILDNPFVGKDSPNPQLRQWSREKAASRLPGLKWLRTLWVAALAGGPYVYVGTNPGRCPFGLEKAHSALAISGPEFDAVASELKRSLLKFQVPAQETSELLSAFAAHKDQVTLQLAGSC